MSVRVITEEDIRLWFENEQEVGTISIKDDPGLEGSKHFLYIEGVLDPHRLAWAMNEIIEGRAAIVHKS